MHDQDSPGRQAPAPRRDRDPQVAYEEEQAWVLDQLLDEYPALMTYEEARIARVRDPEDWGESDAFEIAVRALGRSGLIRRQGDLLMPARPARQMAGLGFLHRLMDEFARLVTAYVGRRIRRRRRAMDIGQEELAARAGVHRTQISLIEHGKVMPRLDTLILLARGLDVAEAQLLAGVDEGAVERRVRRPTAPPDSADHG
jgi:DNA-binding XRE family transcriptional regulator